MANPQEAREVIDRLGLTYARMDFDTQFRLSLLAKHVPDSGARFIFELLQNADNNRFVKANSKGEVPFIRFKVWPDKIIAECNEDGFTAEDVEALCAVGKSTKTTMHGYIGAKGIGFKSVFIAASRVHIQSGHFSFEFKRNSTDSGLFMVLPSWRVPEVTTFGPTTRMTLWLHTDGNAEQITSRNAFLMKQLDDLDVICLLFLKNLGSISVEQYDGKGESVRRRSFTKRNLRTNRIALKTILSEGGHVTTRSHFYHVTRQNATGLPFSSNWYMQASPDNSRPETTADVVLAFPLSAESQPVTDETQHLFAFLPIKKSNYKFLIHSDFDTNIDRNDILVYSKRNHSLLDWITKAFTRAALQFSEEEAMRYKWPVFLPTDEGRASSYWSKLDRMIQESIKSTPLFKSRQGAHFRKIHDLGWIPEKAIIPNGEPIIQSRTTDVWLSNKYTEEALEILGTEYYGLQRFGAVLMDLLKEDTMSDDSRMYSKATSAEWHSLVAESLLYESSAYEGSAKLHHLAIIPLRGGEWVTSEKQFFWPFIGSVTIPTEVDLPILDPAAVADLSRKRLFQHLGAKFATVAQVTELIFSGFKRGVNFVSLECAIERLHFLYLTSPAETLGNTSNPDMYRGKVYLFNSRLERVWPHTHEIYISGEKHPYHPQVLLSGTNTHFVDYVHPFMLRHQPQRPSPRHLLWVEWLHEFLCVRSRVSLFNDSLTDISEAARHVLFYKPLTFLVFLEYLWKQLPESAKTDRAKAIIRGLDVRTICGKRRRLTLQYTWLPTPKLHDVLSRYLENPGDFKSFLRIEGFNASTNAPVSKWSFLCRDFSVDNENNLRFLVHILEDLSNSPRVSRIQLQKLCKLYSAIYDRFVLAKDQVQAKESLVNCFSYPRIYLPGDNTRQWASSSECRWRGPRMYTTHALQGTYDRILGEEQTTKLDLLFHNTLSIAPVSGSDIVYELRHIKRHRLGNLENAQALYKCLSEVKDARAYSGMFRSEALIYAECQGRWGWHTITSCMWSSEAENPSIAILDKHYKGLETLFVDGLGVSNLTVPMLLDGLHNTSFLSVGTPQARLFAINHVLRDAKYLDPSLLRHTQIFPINHPWEEVIVNKACEFAIPDSAYLKQRFSDSLILLKLSSAQVQTLKPLFTWLELDDRYLSKQVKTITSVDDVSEPPSPSATRNMRRRAHHFFRIAAAFNSPRFLDDSAELLQQLCNVSVVETDKIVEILTVTQNGGRVTLKRKAGGAYINDTTIYVPKQTKKQMREQISCANSALPEAYAEWLMRDLKRDQPHDLDNQLIVNISLVLGALRTSGLDETLDNQRLARVALPFGHFPLPTESGDSDCSDEGDSQSSVNIESAQSTVSRQPFMFQLRQPVLSPGRTNANSKSSITPDSGHEADK